MSTIVSFKQFCKKLSFLVGECLNKQTTLNFANQIANILFEFLEILADINLLQTRYHPQMTGRLFHQFLRRPKPVAVLE